MLYVSHDTDSGNGPTPSIESFDFIKKMFGLVMLLSKQKLPTIFFLMDKDSNL